MGIIGLLDVGAKGKDLTVRLPPGTVVREAIGAGGARDAGRILAELLKPGQVELVLPGGRGGKGNASFKTHNNTAPTLSEDGEKGEDLGGVE